MATTPGVTVCGASAPAPASSELVTVAVVGGGISAAFGLACLVGSTSRRRLYGRYIAAVGLRRRWQRGHRFPYVPSWADAFHHRAAADGANEGTPSSVPTVDAALETDMPFEIVPAAAAAADVSSRAAVEGVTEIEVAIDAATETEVTSAGIGGCLRAVERLRFRRALVRICTHDRDTLEWFPNAERRRFLALYLEFLEAAHADTDRRYRLYAEIEQLFRACCRRTRTGAIKLGQTAAVLGGVSLLGAVALKLWS